MLTAAEAQTAFSVEDISGSLHTPGLVNESQISFTPSGLNVTVVFGSTARVLFNSGALAGGYGTVAGANSNSYTVSLAAFVPGSGSATVYVVATAIQKGQQSSLITAPSPGHPDYDPTFVPYTTYLENLDSVSVSPQTGVPNNLTQIELCRVVLTAGESVIPSVITSFQVRAGAVLSQDGEVVYADLDGSPFPWTSAGTTISNTITSAYAGQYINVGGSGTTQTLQLGSVLPGMAVGFYAVSPFTLASGGGGGIVGNTPGGAIQTSVSLAKGDFICLQSDGNTWRVFSCSPDLWYSSNLAPTGHTQWPNGLLMNWGAGTCPAGSPPLSTTVTFDKPFQSAVYSVTLGGVTNLPPGISYQSLTLTGMTLWTNGGGGELITYMAIGI